MSANTAHGRTERRAKRCCVIIEVRWLTIINAGNSDTIRTKESQTDSRTSSRSSCGRTATIMNRKRHLMQMMQSAGSQENFG